MKENRAFTLLELLVAIVCLLVLASLLLVGVEGLRKRANLASSIANLRNIGATVPLFAAENRGRWCYFGGGGQPETEDENGFWSTPILSHPNYGGLVGAGQLLPYLQSVACFADPAMPDYLFVKAQSLENGAISGNYPTRGFAQSSVFGPNGNRPGRKLIEVTNRAIISSFFMHYRGNPESNPLSPTGRGWAVLYGNGSVKHVPIPEWIDPKNPPEIWNNSQTQARMWDYFDSNY